MSGSEQTGRVHVALGDRSYDIEIGVDCLKRAGEFLLDRRTVTHAVIVTDGRVEDPHGERVAEGISEAGIDVDVLVVESGERTKSTEIAAELWNKLLELGADRKTVIVAVGGGVVGDLAGFVAATFARGLPLLQVPTTLLSQVDSSVGGKVGVNLPGAKNMVGAFWQPIGVLIDTETLKTLPEREYRSGLAEVVKYGVIQDAAFFEYLEQNVEGLLSRWHSTLEHVIARCCRLKADVVEADEYETTGRRAILNYGHTFGHALEALTTYQGYLHGEAVAVGMVCAARLAQRLGRVDDAFVQRQQKLLMRLGLPVTLLDVDPDQIVSLMMRDKKVEHGRLRFVLPSRLGEVELVGDVDPQQVRAALLG